MAENKYESGFTLAEMMVAIVLVGIMAMAMMGMTRLYQNSYRQTREISQAFQNANFAHDLMLREIRGSDNISQTGATITFTDSNGVNITYRRIAGTNQLQRVVGGAPEIVAEQVVAFNTNYVANTNNSVVLVTLTINDNGSMVTLRNAVRARNL